MAGWMDLGNIWTTFKELDIRPIRDEAERSIILAFVGRKGVGKSTLIAALRHDVRAREKVISPTIEADLESAEQANAANLIVLMLDATQSDYSAEAKWYSAWKNASRNVLVFYNKMDAVTYHHLQLDSEKPRDVAHRHPGRIRLDPESKGADDNARDAAIRATIAGRVSSMPWSDGRIAFGSALDLDSLATDFVPRVLNALPNDHLALARRYPLFRFAVARELIADTSLANATYALGTGLAEVIPALDIPFNVADVVILTKNQALMVYKLGLALGLSTRWQDHVAQLGGVVGAGFLWRQVARQLVGLIPVWGIVPKVAVAYAGTQAVGEAILYWYRTGNKISAKGMRDVYGDALARGRQVAQNLLSRAPRPALPRVTMPALPRGRAKKVCANCGKENRGDAIYCAYCGTAFK